MTFPLRRTVLKLGLAMAALAPTFALAQAWPNKPVRIILPYAPGGSADILARVLAQKLGASLGQQFIVENKPGASGNIGTEAAAGAVPDGYTLLLTADSNFTVNPHIYPDMRFNLVKDLVPISQLARIGVGLVVNASVPVNNVAELVAYSKARPDGLSFGSPGTGTPHHLAGELLKQMTGAKLVHIPYKGGGPALNDVLGNQVPAAFIALAVVAPHVQSGKLKLLAVTQAARSATAPTAPTVGETIKGYEVTSWLGLFAPAGTPPAIVNRVNAEVKKALLDPATAQELGARALEVVAGTPAELAERITVENERWGKLIKDTKIVVAP
ncbi:tripartite tricarboxylate transporter substrate binding protein [Comamonadaceae bacterium G21597-S1]|nr:tripartite tricarboxylate transporter substrate binding protein [Comamonadaceae bacterium G21597-S1]